MASRGLLVLDGHAVLQGELLEEALEARVHPARQHAVQQRPAALQALGALAAREQLQHGVEQPGGRVVHVPRRVRQAETLQGGQEVVLLRNERRRETVPVFRLFNNIQYSTRLRNYFIIFLNFHSFYGAPAKEH